MHEKKLIHRISSAGEAGVTTSHNCKQGMRFLLLVLLPFLPLSALADNRVAVHGFGTLGISCFSDRQADFAYYNVPNGPGRSRSCDTGLDSILGLQLDAALSETLSAVLQVTSQHTPHNNFNPEVSLAHLKWQASDELTLRLGRVSNPLFLNSDYLQVHFSLPAARFSTELYGLSPTYTMNGIDGFYRETLHDWSIEYYAGYQRSDFLVPVANSSVVNGANYADSITLSASAERGPWLYKFGLNQGKLTYNTGQTDALFNALRTLNPASYPGAATLANQLELSDTLVHIYTLALRYEENNWLMQTEIARRTFDQSYYRDDNAGYVTFGYHLGLWMPYTTLARRKSYGPDNDSRAGPLAGQVNALLAKTRSDQSSFMLGASREIGKSAVIKAQVQWLQPDRGSNGVSLLNASPQFNHANPPLDRLLSINLDFVF